MSIIVAIGGGELKDLETLPIDRAIVSLSGKKHPRVLFVPTASNDAIGYWETFQNVYQEKLHCKVDVLFLFREKFTHKQIEEKIFSADIIYVGGGNTLRMLRVWKKYGVDYMFRKAYKKGIILAGLSAGAIAWFRYGVSDSRRFMKDRKEHVACMRVSALGILPFTVSPHHIREKEFRDRGVREIMQRTSGVALALDDNVAILFQGGKYKILHSKSEAVVKKVFRSQGKICMKSVPAIGTVKELGKKE